MGSWYEGAEAAAFTRVENGYVYSNPWFVGPSRHYLVNEAQKAAITERVRQIRWVMPVGAVAGLFVGVMVLSMVKPDRMVGDIWWFVLMLAVAAPIVATAYIYMIHKLRPLVAGLPPTHERVTWSDRLKVRAAHTSWSWLVGIGVLFGAFVLFSVLRFAVTGIWNDLAMAVICFPYVVYCFALAVYRAGQPSVGLHT